ncbi:MAG TPA: hypothetical protein VGI19_03295 [Candidatus Cybelea sp.]|jgi:hypothetical protein
MTRLRQSFSACFVVAVSACSSPAPQAISGAIVPATSRIERATASGTLTTLYSFQGQPDGANPRGSVNVSAYESATDILGNTSSGGTNDAGTIYTLSVNQGRSAEEILMSYTLSQTGSNPTGAIEAHYGHGHAELLGTASQGGPPRRRHRG